MRPIGILLQGLLAGQASSAVPAFDPASLFDGGEAGTWFDPNDLTTLGPTDSGTGSVSVGSAVGYMADKSGNGNHATQANADYRPILRQNAITGAYYLEFDGTDDFLGFSNDGITGGSARSVHMGLNTTTEVEGAATFFGYGARNPTAGGAYEWNSGLNGALDFRNGSGFVVFTSTISNRQSLFTSTFAANGDNVDIVARINGQAVTIDTSSTRALATTDTPIYIGAAYNDATTGQYHTALDFYGLLMTDDVTTAEEIENYEEYLAPLVGAELPGGGYTPPVVETGDAAITITTTAPTGIANVAPAGFMFKANPTDFSGLSTPGTYYDPDFHEIFYDWDFGDIGAQYSKTKSVPTTFADANSAIGQYASHVYTSPGVYTVTCTARKITSLNPLTVEQAVNTAEVTVTDIANLPFKSGGASTLDGWYSIAVSSQSDWTGAPSGWQQRTETGNAFDPNNDWAARIEQLARANTQGQTRFRIAFKRGETYQYGFLPSYAFSLYGDVIELLYITTWGDPADPPPKFITTTGSTGFGNKEAQCSIVIDGIQTEGTYNPATETGSGFSYRLVDPGYYLVNNCKFSKNNSAPLQLDSVDQGSNPGPIRFFIHDCETEDNGTYFFFGEQTADDEVHILGCHDPDRADVPQGGDGVLSGAGNEQGPIRLYPQGIVNIANNDFCSFYGWTNAGNYPGTSIQSTGEQSPLRITTGRSSTSRIQFTRNSCEGGIAMIGVNSSGGIASPVGNIVVDSNIYLASAVTDAMVDSLSPCLTVRNNLMIKTSLTATPFPMDALVKLRVDGDGPSEAIAAEKVSVYNNTIVNNTSQSAVTSMILDADATFTDTTNSNNVVYAPSVTSQSDHEDIAPFSSSNLFTPLKTGSHEYADPVKPNPDYATPAAQVSLYRPQAGSSVVDDATTGTASYHDLLGNPRGETPSRGCIEPEL